MSSQVENRKRLEAVHRSGLIGSEREAVFDELTAAAAGLLEAPFAFLTVVDTSQSFWKSTFGIADATRANSVGDSFCQYVIESKDELILGDVTVDPITMENPSIESMGVRAWAGFPVLLDGEVLGTFCVVDERERDWTARDREILRSLAASASRELQYRNDLIEAQDETDRIAGLLEIVRTSLLPPALPPVPGIEVAAWFQAAGNGDLLLGDFYDVFPLSNGRWGFVIGDVCGHGAAAARLTSLIRYTLRAAAVHHLDPAAVLAEVDSAMHIDQTEPGRFATACFLSIDVGNELVSIGRAGHTLPIVRSFDGSARLVEVPTGPPLGAIPDGSFVSREETLRPGETWILYTDGVTESRSAALGEQLTPQGLIDIVESAATDEGVDALLGRIQSTLLERTRHFTDDVAVLVMRRTADQRA